MLTASLATALVYGWGGVLAVHGVLDVGTVVALTSYLTRLYGPLTSLSNVKSTSPPRWCRSSGCSRCSTSSR